ncbi:MAG: hypothetical protein NTX61_11410 [Bacteroidetes bacterium]|nr:hypothetical protein [Bacteroidota bacterium]
MKRISTLFFICSLFAIFISCTKNKNSETDLRANLNVANEIVWSQSEFRFIFNMIIRSQNDSLLQASHLAVIDSALVGYKPSQHKYSFCFTGSMCSDSIHRFGRFEAVSDTCFLVPGSVTTVNFIDYYDECGEFLGFTDSIIFTGTNESNNLVFIQRIKNGMLLKYLSDSVSSIVNLNSETELKISSAGFNNTEVASFLMKGICSGTSSRGHSFQAYFDTLENNVMCPWFTKGIIHFSIKNAAIPTGIISFISSDGCNNRINYDFEGNDYHWTNNPGHLRN